jgi:hypothetical protein
MFSRIGSCLKLLYFSEEIGSRNKHSSLFSDTEKEFNKIDNKKSDEKSKSDITDLALRI